MCTKKNFFLIYLLIFFDGFFCEYVVPDALVEVFRPRGLRVSIPDEEGIKLFAFHGKINEELNGREGGTLSRDIPKAKNGRWTFYDPTVELKVGDVLYYWTYVDYFDGKNKLGYVNDDQEFVVTELLDKESKTCRASVTVTSKNQTNCRNQLVFSEDFDSLQDNVWTREIRFAGGPDNEFVLYGNRPENLAVKDGLLQIRPLPSEEVYGKDFVRQHLDLGDKCTGVPGTLECVQTQTSFLILPPVASAQISTKNKFAFRYGKVEIRAKLPKGDWIYPELYLNPQSDEYGPGYASGQIRVAFLQGNADTCHTLHGGCILSNSVAGRSIEMKNIRKNEGSWSDDFHKFEVTWGPGQISVSVDGMIYGNVYAPEKGFAELANRLGLSEYADRWRSGTNFAPFDKPMYLTVGVGVGGQNFEDRSDGTKPWRKTEAKAQRNFYKAQDQWRPTWGDDSVLKVDYIKVWAT